MKILKYIILAAAFCLPCTASAQFYQSGDDPASVKWMYVESPHFRVIYPKSLDSLARSYALELEKYRLPVSGSAGFAPGEKMSGKMPVVLHPFSAVANGLVTWAPKRMDLYTSPQGYGPEPMPWMTMLAIHESRHVAQMQFGLSGWFRPFRYVFGEMFAGALAGIYPDKWLLEGDAVVAETALSRSGRGRTADFLNYYRIAFDAGDFRNTERWAYGSYWHYTPDHYAFGYMTLSGIRYLYDVPDFSGRLFTHFAGHPWDITAKNTVSKRLTGRKFRALVSESAALYHEIWNEDEEKRGPFLEYRIISGTPKVHTEYSDNLVFDGELYSLKESFNKGRSLVKTDEDGKETRVSAFGSEAGKLFQTEDRIYWSETLPDVRWSLKYNSAIRYMDMETGRKKTLAGGKRLFGPSLSPDGKHIVAARYTDGGLSRLCIIDARTGAEEISFSVPDSLQLVEPVWLDGGIYATAVSEHGYGIYRLDSESFSESCELSEQGRQGNGRGKAGRTGSERHVWKTVLAPSPVKIFDLGAERDLLMFTSDRTGVNEMYLMEPESRRVWQETSFRYGSSDFTFSSDGKYLICAVPDRTGAPLAAVDTDDLLHREVDFHEHCRWEVADCLSRQERDIARDRGFSSGDPYRDDGSLEGNGLSATGTGLSAPKRYRKFPHLFNLHSWAPVYFDYDNISNGSYEDYYSYASIGATALFQNRLSTFTGMAGYSFHQDPVAEGKWRHSGHVKFTYSGLYPVIEATFDINDRAARTLSGYDLYGISADGGPATAASVPSVSVYEYSYGSKPLVSGSLSVYIPFNFSSGGWSRGLIPQISYSVSNDRYAKDNIRVTEVPDFSGGSFSPGPEGLPDPGGFPGSGTQDGESTEIRYIIDDSDIRTAIYQALSASLRFYAVRPAAHADVYPEAGIGIEAGISTHPGLRGVIAASSYLYAYGYVPGIYGNQGLKLTALYGQKLGNSTPVSSAVNTLPRGFTSASRLGSWASSLAYGVRLTADYAMPFPLGDFHIGNLFYVTRGIITPHFDWSFLEGRQLLSAGATLEVEFGNFIGLQFPTTVGVTWSYNAGKSYRELRNLGLSRHFVGPVFSMSF